jgi:hypothetical protein
MGEGKFSGLSLTRVRDGLGHNAGYAARIPASLVATGGARPLGPRVRSEPPCPCAWPGYQSCDDVGSGERRRPLHFAHIRDNQAVAWMPGSWVIEASVACEECAIAPPTQHDEKVLVLQTLSTKSRPICFAGMCHASSSTRCPSRMFSSRTIKPELDRARLLALHTGRNDR